MYNKNSSTYNNFDSLEVDGIKIDDPYCMAQSFNEFFINVTENIDISNEIIDKNYLNRFASQPQIPFALLGTSHEEVCNIIKTLRVSAATGYDSIPTKLIKRYSAQLSHIICHLINDCIKKSVFPECLKRAIVTPIYKSGSHSLCTNFRPISVLNVVSKIFEMIIKDRLQKFIKINDVLHQSQYGFERNSNTTAACLDLTDFVSKNTDRGKYVASLFLDLKKAFDCVDHEILLYKLKLLNLSTQDLIFFESYLTNRFQAVRINERISDFLRIKKGVPQGSVLGPDLFKIYIDAIGKLNLNGYLQLFADDTVISYSADSLHDLTISVQRDLDILETFFKKHKLALNVPKTKFLIYENKIITDIQLTYKNEPIQIVKNYNYLGLIVDSKLKFHEHVDSIAKRIVPYVFILRRLKRYLNENSLFAIYSAHILSHINYVNPIWSRTSNYKLEKINILQKKAIKIILGLPPLHPTETLYTPKYISFSQICKIELLLLAYKIINKLIKHRFLLNRAVDVHQHNTRNKANFYLSFFKSDSKKSNCLYQCLNEFNKLPVDIKELTDTKLFVKRLRDYVIRS